MFRIQIHFGLLLCRLCRRQYQHPALFSSPFTIHVRKYIPWDYIRFKFSILCWITREVSCILFFSIFSVFFLFSTICLIRLKYSPCLRFLDLISHTICLYILHVRSSAWWLWGAISWMGMKWNSTNVPIESTTMSFLCPCMIYYMTLF